MQKRELTCTVCPMGCEICVETDGGKVLSVGGNTCRRGEDYAVTEVTAPVRTLTSTIRCDNGKLLPVKTKKPIPKEKMRVFMDVINQLVVHTED
ncbi:MAG: DUF1667 domain-containing protein [Clostridia bacterium]|nr:DUF1667 domain-containing protein [Clostridia bacterium]